MEKGKKGERNIKAVFTWITIAIHKKKKNNNWIWSERAKRALNFHRLKKNKLIPFERTSILAIQLRTVRGNSSFFFKKKRKKKEGGGDERGRGSRRVVVVLAFPLSSPQVTRQLEKEIKSMAVADRRWSSQLFFSSVRKCSKYYSITVSNSFLCAIVFRCGYASLYEGLFVRPLVRTWSVCKSRQNMWFEVIRTLREERALEKASSYLWQLAKYHSNLKLNEMAENLSSFSRVSIVFLIVTKDRTYSWNLLPNTTIYSDWNGKIILRCFITSFFVRWR